MGIGLHLRGEITVPLDEPLRLAEQVLRDHYGDALMSLRRFERDGGAALSCRVHPAAAPVSLVLRREPAQPDRLTISAATSSVGPGYHADLCLAIDALGARLSIAWAPADEDGAGDETGYFQTRDRAALERKMLGWLSTVAGILKEQSGMQALGLSMPMTPIFRGPPGALLLTLLGPRDCGWLDAVCVDPRAGIDIFPWWGPGRDASYELGRALVHLWLDVRFHAAATDEEERIGREVVKSLGRAYRQDPSLEYPWAAWALVHDEVVDEEDDDLSGLVRASADRAGENTVGYRLHDVTVSVDRWSFTLPGSFSCEVDDRGTWCFWEGGNTVEATSFQDAGPPREAADRLASLLLRESEVQIDGLVLPHRATEFTITRVSGQTAHGTRAYVATRGRLLLISVAVPSRKELAWARGVLASVRS